MSDLPLARRSQPLLIVRVANPVADALGDLWRYRELVRNLVLRDLKVRYRSSVLGFAWSLLNPLLMMLVFTVVFTVLTPSSAKRVPFPVFILTGLLAWNFTLSSVMGCMTSITSNANLVKKVYFPREVLPIAAVFANAVNFLLALVVLFAIIAFYKLTGDPSIQLTAAALLFPLIFAMQVCFLLGLGLMLATINVFLRDTEVIVEVGLLAWFFLTPIFYDVSDIFRSWNGLDLPRLMYILNPMASFISNYREIFLYGSAPDAAFLLRLALTSLAALAVGYGVFRRYARSMVEEL